MKRQPRAAGRPPTLSARPERFEFAGPGRGAMAALRWKDYEVMLAEWPGSLLAMLRAAVLGPEAQAEAAGMAGAPQAPRRGALRVVPGGRV